MSLNLGVSSFIIELSIRCSEIWNFKDNCSVAEVQSECSSERFKGTGDSVMKIAVFFWLHTTFWTEISKK